MKRNLLQETFLSFAAGVSAGRPSAYIRLV
jgi:hypothetical protein